jgi:rhomboid protease GluP
MSDNFPGYPSTPSAPQIRHGWPPIATLVILLINVILFAWMEWAGGSQDANVLLEFGASFGPYIRRGEYWRLVMPMFLHIGLAHLIMNSLALYVLGRILENVYGYGRYSVLYVASGIGSSFLSMMISQGPAAGASGSIMGIAGAILAIGFLHRHTVPWRWRRTFGAGILPLILINLALGYSVPGIDNWGHIGGLFTGMVVAGLMPPPGLDEYHGPEPTQSRSSQFMIVIPLAVVALAAGWAFESHRLSLNTERLLDESRKLRAAGKFDQAIERAKAASQLAPKDERPHEMIAALMLQVNRVDDAITEYREARRLNPLSIDARRGLAGAFVRKGDIESATLILEEMLGKDAQTADGQRLLGDLCQQDGLDRLAIKYYEHSLELNPDQAATHNNLAWLLATSPVMELRDPGRALAHAQKAVALDGWKQAAYIDTLAEALYVNGRFSEAVTTQTRALQMEPDNQEYQDHMKRYRKGASSGTS